MLITDTFSWDLQAFEAYVEGMCSQIETFPQGRVAFIATSSIETILTLFAIWKLGKTACPLSHRFPSVEPILNELETTLFTPTMPLPLSPKPWKWHFEAHTFLLTSGSTGRPKIACLTFNNLVQSALGSNELISLTPTDKWALSLPLFHVGGLGILLRCYLAKCSILLSDHWEAATHLSLVPTQLFRLLQSQKTLPHIKTILLGGAPLPHLQTPWHVVPSYGMTEMSSQIITNHKVHPNAEVKIAQNEIWVRGSVLFQGYYTKKEGIHLPLNEHGWFVTKDLGRWENGKFQIVGRQDNQFISGGENIQPEEIEELIRHHLGLEEAYVVPMADEEFGSRPVAFVRPYVPVEVVRNKLIELLPKFKVPIRVYPLPESEGIKMNREKLIQMGMRPSDG